MYALLSIVLYLLSSIDCFNAL